MGAQLAEPDIDNTIPVREMKQGQVGVITRCCEDASVIGGIVLTHGHSLISVGDKEYWDNIPQGDGFRVRILPSGTTIKIT